MRCCLLFVLLLFYGWTNAQYKSFRIGSNGDTLNAIDQGGKKQGKWTLHVDPLRGEPGYEEEGVFKDDRKEGLWRRYSLMGDLIAQENYRWGNKNGVCRYFSMAGIREREESWRAVNPDKAYDTIDVPDPKNPNQFEKVVVKNEGVSLKHGTWRYYDPTNGRLVGTENYFLDQLRQPGDENPSAGLTKVVPTADTTKAKTPEKPKPKEVLDFEKKTSGKKKALRDGRTGG
jgi:hypothetical protein